LDAGRYCVPVIASAQVCGIGIIVAAFVANARDNRRRAR
jgi:hypothetical protein